VLAQRFSTEKGKERYRWRNPMDLQRPSAGTEARTELERQSKAGARQEDLSNVATVFRQIMIAKSAGLIYEAMERVGKTAS